jgi:hypothetical protein
MFIVAMISGRGVDFDPPPGGEMIAGHFHPHSDGNVAGSL